MRRQTRVVPQMPRYTGVLTTYLNNSFYALGHVELWKRSQKIVGNFRRIWLYRTTQVVRVMPDFKAIVCVEGQLPFTVATPSTP
jgi:hypothetical protein